MSNSTTVYVFIDANTALHFERPDQIDWRKLTNANEVVLVAAPILLRELENQKIVNRSQKLRDRAGAYIKWLHPFVQDPATEVRPNVTWLFLPDEPQIDFAAEHLSEIIADDHIIASVLYYTRQSGANAAVATADLGLEIKLRGRGIDVLALPDDLCLPAELDSLERENRNLQRKIARIESRMPKLSVAFEGGNQFHALHLRDPNAIDVKSLAQVRADHPLMSIPGEVARPSEGIASSIANIQRLTQQIGIPAERAHNYNEKLKKYFSDYQQYLDQHADWREDICMHHQIKFVITNDGTARASHVDVDLFFPKGTVPVDQDDIPKRPEPPDAPRRPQSILDVHFLDYLSPLMHKNLPQMIVPDIYGVPIIGPEKDSVCISYSALKHGFSVTSDPLIFRFVSRDSVESFSIGYRLSADELPDAVEGDLHIRIDDAR